MINTELIANGVKTDVNHICDVIDCIEESEPNFKAEFDKVRASLNHITDALMSKQCI